MKRLKIILAYKYLILFFFTCCYVFYVVFNFIYYPKHKIEENIIYGTITSISNNGFTLAKENIQVTCKCQEFKIGDYVMVEGILSIPNNNTIFNLFNYRLYLMSNKIYYSMKADSVIKIKDGNVLYKIKQKIYEKVDTLKSKVYVKTFLLGDKNDLDINMKNIFKENGISHLLAVSGMHISLITIALEKIFGRFKYTHIIISIFLIFYMFLTNFTPSVIRATLFYIFSKKIPIKKLIFYIASFMLLYNPYYIYNSGFLFSFTISFYLIYFNKIINKYKNYFIRILITSFISLLASFPILINNFYTLNLLIPFINVLFVPFVSFIIFPLCFLSLIIPFFDNILSFLIFIFESLSIFINSLNINLTIGVIPIYIVVIYYLVLTIILLKPKYFLLFVIILFYINFNNNRDFIAMLDVNQGDSLLLAIDYNNILIDSGGNRYSEYSIVDNKIIPYLKSLGINKLNYYIITHGDYDHMGEAINLVENFKVENVIFNCGEYNDLEKELISLLDKKNIKYYSCIKELNVDKYKLQFLNTKEYDNENDNSNVIYLNYNGYKFLFMGDAGIEKEKDILDKYNLENIDFLKVGHHGSNTSSSEYFIDKINPKYSLMSVGKNNRYGHPKEEVLETLSNSKIYRTDQDGSIEIKLNKNGYKIRTCPP